MTINQTKYLELSGRENKDLAPWVEGEELQIHSSMKEPLQELVNDAKKSGINISLVSGYRSFEKQLAIWNAKASGKRKLLDRNEQEVDFNQSSKQEILEAILAWSALPGASRHHWGTEIDIFDSGIKDRNKVSLTQRECQEDFHKLYNWIDSNLKNYPFHRPYSKDRGGVSMEPWHLSYTPLSMDFQNLYTLDVFEKNIREAQILLKEEILIDLEGIYSQYIQNVSNPV